MNWQSPVAGAILSLSPRELQVVKLIAADEPTKAIAARLHISPKTVEHHRAAVYHKLGVNSTIRLTHLALAYGLVQNKFS